MTVFAFPILLFVFLPLVAAALVVAAALQPTPVHNR
jgi:hypothetical protein